MRTLFLSLLTSVLLYTCSAQDASSPDPRLVGAPCEGCEAILEVDKRELKATDTLSLFHTSSKPLKISGTIYQADGKTPAAGVILYVYHTDEGGVYPSEGNEKDWSRRHGHIRAWLKTDQSGRYTFYTGQPASYPGREVAAHIHPTLLEPNGKYYYVEDYYFAGDPYLTKREMAPKAPRGGTNGVLQLKKEGNLWVGKRDFILGKNVPDYQ